MRCRIVNDPDLSYPLPFGGKGWRGGNFSSYRVLWYPPGVDDPAQVRRPIERTESREYRRFVAGGLVYDGPSDLERDLLRRNAGGDWSMDLFLDVHGRVVLREYEHVPYFDSHDAMYDDRAYYWYNIFAEDEVVRVEFAVPDCAGVTVTEDAAAVSTKVYAALFREGLINKEGWLA